MRHSALRATVVPLVTAVYAVATWGSPHRGAMLAVAAVMVAVAAVTYGRAAAIGRSPARKVVQGGGLVVAVVGCAALSLLDGGVAGPLGFLVPFSLIYLAIVTPPRVFAAVAALGAAAYWTVVLIGGPAPRGYPVVYTLGVAGIAYGCLRHATALASLRRRLAEVSRVDPLTRCLNRRGFDERLAALTAEADRGGEPVTLVLADLDRFKEVNDRYGHQVGDRLLTWAGGALAEALGGRRAVGRLGGDEFGAVLAGTDADTAKVRIDRLRALLEGSVPASIGYATYPVEARTVEELTQLADKRVYEDKAARDRRVTSAEAVRQACAGTTADRAGWVARQERRRRSIAHVGWNAVSNCTVGLVYTAFFGAGTPNRFLITMWCLAGVLVGGLVVVAADRLSRLASPRFVTTAGAAVLYALAVGNAVLDGGVSGAVSLGMLAGMPLVALGAPARHAAGLLGFASVCYVVVGVVVGASSGWYIAMHLIGILGVCLGCADLGRRAAHQRRLLTRLSTLDSLTGCLNRRGFEERFAVEVGAGRRAVSLLIFDLDGFKTVNDTQGHAAGDELLRWVAATLGEHVGPRDVVGRLGGDEFVVLLTGASAAHAAATGGGLRTALAARTPASVGHATLGRDGQDFDTLYAHADALLYAEKARRGAARRAAGHGDRAGRLKTTVGEPMAG